MELQEPWRDPARMQREERMRYEVLHLLYEQADHGATRQVNVGDFLDRPGALRVELYRAIEYLDRHGYVRYVRGGPTVCLTRRGIDFIERGAGRRRSIRDSENRIGADP